MKKSIIIIICLLGLSLDHLFSQINDINQYISSNEGNRWLFFTSGKNSLKIGKSLTIEQVVEQIFFKSGRFTLNKEDVLKVQSVSTIDKNHKRYLIQHLYKGIPVEGSAYYIHTENDVVSVMHGSILEKCSLDIRDLRPKQEILRQARSGLRQAPGQEATSIDSASLSLIITKSGPGRNSWEGLEPVIAYVVSELGETRALKNRHYYLAKTGEFLRTEENGAVYIGMSPGTGNTEFNGTQGFETKWTGSSATNRYILHDTQRKIHTYEKNHGNEVRDYDNVWTDAADRPGVSVHWALGKTWEYFNSTFQWKGMDGLGSEVVGIADFSQTPCNAYFNPSDLYLRFSTIAQNCTSHPPVSIETVSHEYTHGVAHHMFGGFSQSSTYPEAGALGESFSDIFGSLIEFYVEGSADWKMGDDFWDNNNRVRSLASPNNFGGYGTTAGLPAYYLQSGYWDTGGNIHINCGVQNHWFYLLSEGGSLNAITVSGIGKTKAAEIAFRTMKWYMTPTSDYTDARIASTNAAISLYGLCSNEVRQTLNAWDAVKVPVGYQYTATTTMYFCNAPGGDFRHLGGIISNCNFSTKIFPVQLESRRYVDLLPGFISSKTFQASICQ